MNSPRPTALEVDEDDGPREGEVVLDASQLRAGVHVRLPVGWLDHPFVFNSFVITEDAQVQQIASLGLPRLYSDPRRCTAPPLPQPQPRPAPSAEQQREQAELAQRTARALAQKQARAQAMAELRARLDRAQAHYAAAAQAVGTALRNFESRPREAVQQVAEVSAQSAQVLMADADSAIALIAEKGHRDIAHAHALSVMTLALLLGKHARLGEAALREVGTGALLHDIGKSRLDGSLLRKTDRSRFEEAIYQTHAREGHAVALRAGGLSRAVLDAIVGHHEHCDGTGFPGRASGKAIPLAARIVAIANRFDNLANPLDPRRALTPSEALATMWSRERARHDELLLQLFVRAMGVYPPGSLVQLADGRIGVVVASAATESPLQPQVLVYDPAVPRRHALIVDLAAQGAIRIERSLSPAERSPEELDYLLPRRKLSWFHMNSAA